MSGRQWTIQPAFFKGLHAGFPAVSGSRDCELHPAGGRAACVINEYRSDLDEVYSKGMRALGGPERRAAHRDRLRDTRRAALGRKEPAFVWLEMIHTGTANNDWSNSRWCFSSDRLIVP